MTDLDTLRRALRAPHEAGYPGPGGNGPADVADIIVRGRRLRWRRRAVAAGGSVCLAVAVLGAVAGIGRLTTPSPGPARHTVGPIGPVGRSGPVGPIGTARPVPVPSPSPSRGGAVPSPVSTAAAVPTTQASTTPTTLPAATPTPTPTATGAPDPSASASSGTHAPSTPVASATSATTSAASASGLTPSPTASI